MNIFNHRLFNYISFKSNLVLLVFLLLVGVGYSQKSKSNHKSDVLIDDTVLANKLMQLPEIQSLNKRIDSISNGKHGVTFMTQSTPNSQEPYYWVQVGYNGEFRFETYYNFYIYNKGQVIKYLDTVNDTVISLKEWRRRLEQH